MTENTGIGIFYWYSRLEIWGIPLPCKVNWNLLSDQIKCNLGSSPLILLQKYSRGRLINTGPQIPFIFSGFPIHMNEKVDHVNLSHNPTHSVNALLHASPHWDWWLPFPVRLFIVLPVYILISTNLISLWIETDFNVNLCVSFNQWIQTLLQSQGWMGCCWALFQLKGHGPSHAVSSEFHQASPKGSCYCLSPLSILKLLSEEASPVTNIHV